jgi:hypothetical protein
MERLVHPTFDDVRVELLDLSREVRFLERAMQARTRDGEALTELELWETCTIYASAAEKTYLGFERILKLIISDIDVDPVRDRDSWHKALLARVSAPYLDRRDAVLAPRTFALLDDLRAFRHRVRNSYGVDLDIEAVTERARDSVRAFALFEADVLAFFARRA